jgi:photosystem II stability/assembly factor-like uncharacterized protein
MFVQQNSVAIVSVYLARDDNGEPKTGLVPANIDLYFIKYGQTTPTQKVMDTGNFVEIDAANMPGMYLITFSAAEMDTVGEFVATIKRNVSVNLAQTSLSVLVQAPAVTPPAPDPPATPVSGADYSLAAFHRLEDYTQGSFFVGQEKPVTFRLFKGNKPAAGILSRDAELTAIRNGQDFLPSSPLDQNLFSSGTLGEPYYELFVTNAYTGEPGDLLLKVDPAPLPRTEVAASFSVVSGFSVWTAAFIVQEGSKIFANTAPSVDEALSSVYVTQNRGDTWTRIVLGFSGDRSNGLWKSPTGRIVAAGRVTSTSEPLLFVKEPDSSVFGRVVLTGLTGDILRIATDDPNYLVFVDSTNQVRKWEYGGGSVTSSLNLNETNLVRLYAKGDLVLAIRDTTGIAGDILVYTSVDGGDSFSNYSIKAKAGGVTGEVSFGDLLVEEDRWILAATRVISSVTTTVLYITEDEGETWVEIQPGGYPADRPVRKLLRVPDGRLFIYALGSTPALLAYSEDNGLNWQIVPEIADLNLSSTVYGTAIVDDMGIYFTRGRSLGLYRYEDGMRAFDPTLLRYDVIPNYALLGLQQGMDTKLDILLDGGGVPLIGVAPQGKSSSFLVPLKSGGDPVFYVGRESVELTGTLNGNYFQFPSTSGLDEVDLLPGKYALQIPAEVASEPGDLVVNLKANPLWYKEFVDVFAEEGLVGDGSVDAKIYGYNGTLHTNKIRALILHGWGPAKLLEASWNAGEGLKSNLDWQLDNTFPHEILPSFGRSLTKIGVARQWAARGRMLAVVGTSGRFFTKQVVDDPSFPDQATGTWVNRSLDNLFDNTLYGVAVWNETNVWACGRQGRIIYFNGTDVITQTTPVTSTLNCIANRTATTLFAGGDNGVLLQSTNGGTTWTDVSARISTTESVQDIVFFLNDDTFYNSRGILVTTSSVYVTTNGGTTWTLQTMPTPTNVDTPVEYTGCSFTVFNRVGGGLNGEGRSYVYGRRGIIYRRIDAFGAPWVQVHPEEEVFYKVMSVTENLGAVDAFDGFASDDGQYVLRENPFPVNFDPVEFRVSVVEAGPEALEELLGLSGQKNYQLTDIIYDTVGDTQVMTQATVRIWATAASVGVGTPVRTLQINSSYDGNGNLTSFTSVEVANE